MKDLAPVIVRHIPPSAGFTEKDLDDAARLLKACQSVFAGDFEDAAISSFLYRLHHNGEFPGGWMRLEALSTPPASIASTRRGMRGAI